MNTYENDFAKAFDVNAIQENIKTLFDAEKYQTVLKDLYNTSSYQEKMDKYFSDTSGAFSGVKEYVESLADQEQVQERIQPARRNRADPRTRLPFAEGKTRAVPPVRGENPEHG